MTASESNLAAVLSPAAQSEPPVSNEKRIMLCDPEVPPSPRVSISWIGILESGAHLATIIAVIGVVFAVFEYFNRSEEGRQSQSLDMVAAWEQRNFNEDYALLIAKVDSLLRALDETAIGQYEKSTHQEKLLFLGNVGSWALRGTSDEQGERRRIDKLIYFLSRNAICVEKRICSRDVSNLFLLSYATDILVYFKGHIDYRRITDQSFAVDLERYVIASHNGSIPVQPPTK